MFPHAKRREKYNVRQRLVPLLDGRTGRDHLADFGLYALTHQSDQRLVY